MAATSIHGDKQYKKKANRKLLNEMKHDCKLPLEEDILVKYIDSGYFVDFRRKFRGWLMVSESNPRSKMYLKSSFAIRKEKETHLQEFYFMIHPFSQMRYVWEVFMIINLFAVLLVIPIQMCYQGRHHEITIRLAFDIICVIDIIINFNTGYQNANTKKIVMNRRKVAYNYTVTWFALDAITSFNLEAVFLLVNITHISITQQYYIENFPTALKILRIITLMKYMNRYRDVRKYN